jgi:L-alanine-DL-glutamate epimerase-like enolase superfamily enzyme
VARIARLACYSVDLPLGARGYTMSHGRHLTRLRSTVVKVETRDGVAGFGETCTLGGNYIESFPADVQATVRELAPAVLEVPVHEPDVLERVMDRVILGHLGGKAVIDAAMWDLRGKLLGQPLSVLLGGVHQPAYPVFFPVSLAEPAQMVEETKEEQRNGYRCWQLKVGDNPSRDVERVREVLQVVGAQAEFVTCDANGSWTTAEATEFMSGIAGLRTYVEQPCRTTMQLADLRSRFQFPMVVDETVRDAHDLVTAVSMRAADAVNIKPARLGGITRAARIRDLAIHLGLKVIIDDAMGGDIATTAVSHLAASCRPEAFLAASYLSVFTTRSLARSGGATLEGATARAPDGPGLGIEVDEEALGEPVFVVSEGDS